MPLMTGTCDHLASSFTVSFSLLRISMAELYWERVRAVSATELLEGGERGDQSGASCLTVGRWYGACHQCKRAPGRASGEPPPSGEMVVCPDGQIYASNR